MHATEQELPQALRCRETQSIPEFVEQVASGRVQAYHLIWVGET